MCVCVLVMLVCGGVRERVGGPLVLNGRPILVPHNYGPFLKVSSPPFHRAYFYPPLILARGASLHMWSLTAGCRARVAMVTPPTGLQFDPFFFRGVEWAWVGGWGGLAGLRLRPLPGF